jgi:RimJ/RimL family protein N-acetyltransferase
MAKVGVIEGKYKEGRLKLVPLYEIPKERDKLYEIYAEWLNQDFVRRGLGDNNTYTVKDVKEMLEDRASSKYDLHWIIYVETGEKYVPVGDINLRRLSPEKYRNLLELYRRHDPSLDENSAKRTAEIAVLCAVEEYQRMRIATGAINAALEYIKRENIDTVYSNAFYDNIASRRVHEKTGFNTIGRDTEKYGDEYRDILVYRKNLRDEEKQDL